MLVLKTKRHFKVRKKKIRSELSMILSLRSLSNSIKLILVLFVLDLVVVMAKIIFYYF